MKQWQKHAIATRFEEAVKDLYHNATPVYPEVSESDQSKFDSWFEESIRCDLHYLKTGLSYQDKWDLQVKIGFSDDYLRQEWLAQKIYSFGEVYQYGRGGRTLAPEKLVKVKGGSSFTLKATWDNFDFNVEALTTAILILEAFNKLVKKWNKDVPDMWDCYINGEE